MNTSEDKIIGALKELPREDDIETLSGVLADMTRAQSFYLRAFPIVFIFAFLILAIFSAARFFSVEDVQAWIAYATLFLAALIAIAMLKLWLYLVWVRNSLMREIKRMELRSLADRQRT